MTLQQGLNQAIDERKGQFEESLFEWLRMPSVSADLAYREGIHQAADWLVARFQRMGLATEKVMTDSHPIVYAESPPVPGAPVVLVYGHYDVQPPDPLDLWLSPPFEPTVRDGNVYARGSTDDKGQVLTHVLSVETWLATQGPLPVQVKFLIEGEEECGSEALNQLLAGKYSILGKPPLEAIKCDVAVISDTSQFAPGQPAITYGLKGIAYFQLDFVGPAIDLHSGSFGGAITNPINALSRVLGRLVDESGRVQVPGFYDEVQPLSSEERNAFASLPFDEAGFKKSCGVTETTGEVGYSTLERKWARPTCDINGIWGGYQGAGAKTVLPSKAGAKFSFRLVPKQDPVKIVAALKRFIADNVPAGIQWTLTEMHHAPGVVVPLDSPFVAAAKRAIEAGFGKQPVMIREGGSIPVVTSFATILGVDTLLLGWGQNDDAAHSPNEKFSLADFHRGIKASGALWGQLGQMK